MPNLLPQAERLRSFGAIRRLFADGKGGYVYPFRYIVYAEPNEDMEVSFIFSVPKRYHKRAVKRNLIRRRMREAYRLNSTILKTCQKSGKVEVAIIYSSKEVLNYRTIENGICKVLHSVADSL